MTAPAASQPLILATAIFAVAIWGASPPVTKIAVASFDPVLVADRKSTRLNSSHRL